MLYVIIKILISTINILNSTISQTFNSSIFNLSTIGSTFAKINELKLDATNVNGYVTALKGLSTQQAQLIMTTKGLTAAQQQTVLSQISLANATGTLTTAQMTSALITETRNEADVKALLLNTGLISSETAEATATNTVTAAKLKELVATGKLTRAEAQLLATKAGVTLANKKEATSLLILGDKLKNIGGGLMALGRAHPILSLLTLAITLFGTAVTIAEKENEKFIESQKELIEKIDDNISKYEEEISSLNSLQSKLQDAKDNKEALASIQGELNSAIGDTPGLLNKESNAYDIANQKINDRIERLKELRKLELEDKVIAQKEIFNNTLVDNAWGIDYKFEHFSKHKIIAKDRSFSEYLEGLNINKFETLQSIFNTLKKNDYGNGKKSNAQIWKELIDSYGGAMLDIEEIQDYFDNQTEYAQKILSDYVNNSESIFSKEELNRIIANLVESGYSQDLEGIKNVLASLIENDELENTINDYYESLYNDDIDSDALYQNIKSQFDTLTSNYPELKNILDNYLKSIGTDIKTGIQEVADNTLSLDDAKLKILGDSEKGIAGLKDEFSSLQEIISDTGNVSMETYEKLIAKSEGYSRALKIEAGRIVVDNQKLKMVNKTRTESIKKEIKEASTLKKIEWITNAKKLQQYNFQQSDLNSFIWETCNALQEEISQFDLLVQGIDAASNSFTAFQEAQEASQSGDYFDIGLEMANAFQKGLETGRIGNADFIASMQGMMDEDLFAEIINMDDAVAQAKELDKFYDDVISRYYIEGEDAEYDISGIYNFAKDLASFKDEAGNAIYGTFDGKNLQLVDGMDYAQLAKDLKLNVEQVYAIFGELEEYTIGNTYKFDSKNFIEDYYNKLTKVTDAQQLYNDALENGSENQQAFAKFMLDAANADYQEWLEGLGDKILDLEQQWQEQGESNQSFGEYLKNSYSDDEIIMMYSTATERAEALRSKMHELEVSGRKGSAEWKKYNAELEKLDDAIAAIDNTTEKQELLNEAVQSTKERYERLQEIMEALKDPDLDGESMEKLKQEAYELIAALGQLPKSVEIEFKARVAELEEKVKTVEEKKAALEKTEVPGYKYSPAYQAQMGEYNAQIRDYNQEIQEIKAILKLDTEEAKSEIDKIKAEDVDKEGTVTYTANFDACKKGVPPTLDGTVKYEADYSGVKPPSGGGFSLGGGKQYGTNGAPLGVSANGTFNAFATGTGSQVSIPKNETALVNELGEEGLVRDGKLIPIKGGAQLIDLKKGDIIFNHKQMEDLKKHGYTTGRGKLIGDGGIVGAHFKGTIPAYNGNGGYTGGGQGVIGSNSKYDKTVNNSTRNNVKDVEEEKEEEKEITEEFLDWIERRIQKLQRYFDRWFNNAEAMLTKTQMVGDLLAKYYKRASGNLNKQMDVQSQAYGRYMQQADASGLSDDYKQKVRDGLIDIETITDDELKEQISRYQEWYDKANESLAAFEEAANKRFHIPLDKAAKKVEVFGDAIDLLDKKLDNAIGATEKNKLIGEQSKEEKKTLNAYKVAQKESAKNLKSQGKKMTSSSVLKGSDVSKKEQKKIKEAVKSGKEIDIAYFDEGSKAYKQAVKYNEALRANTQAQYDLNVATEEYNAWLVEAAKMKFDNIATDYENAIKQIENSFTDIDNKVAEIEAVGKRVDKSLYENQKNLNDQELAQYKAEKAALEESIKGIKQGTEEWYEALDAIQEVENSISNCTQEAAKLNTAIRELHFSMLDDTFAGIDRITKEQDFLQGLFAHEKLADNDTGNLTDAGIAKLGSLTANYYANEKEKTIATSELNRLKALLAQGDVTGVYGDANTPYNSRDELMKDIDKYYDVVQDYTSELYDSATEIYDLMEQKYQAELEYIKKLIDDQKEALQSQKDLHDYSNTINEKVKSIDTIQRQLTAYSGDTSEEGMAKLQKLSKELADAKDDLKETEYDRYISDQQDMLDKFATEYEEAITNQLEDFKTIVNEGLSTANSNLSSIKDYMSNVANANGYTEQYSGLFNINTGSINANVNTATQKIVDAINKGQTPEQPPTLDGSGNGSNGASTEGIIGEAASTNVPNVNTGLKSGSSTAISDSKSTDASKIKKQVEDIFNDSANYAPGKKEKPSDYETKINQYLFKKNGKVLTTAGLKALRKVFNTNNDGLYDAMVALKKSVGDIKHVGGFKTGGIAKLVKSRGEDGIAMVRNGEGLVAPEHVLAIQELLDTVPLVNDMFKPLIDAPKLPNLTPVNNAANNILQIDTLTLPNVTNWDEFRDKMYKDMQSNKKFEGMVQDMSINQVSGGGRLSKYNRRF